MGDLYQALDLDFVTSREEGGPKAVLESMASGVPLVTTRVGQATDLVRHGENGWIVDVVARRTAEANTHETQLSQWREFMRGFVALGEAAGR